MASIGYVFKAGDEVPHSGIYRVVQDNKHAAKREVTCVYGKRFSPFHGCGQHPPFVFVKAAGHIDTHENFRR